jgi:hypothetical protein
MSSNHRAAQRAQLQAVLACLDLSLESELALYRRQFQPSSTLALLQAEIEPDLDFNVYPALENAEVKHPSSNCLDNASVSLPTPEVSPSPVLQPEHPAETIAIPYLRQPDSLRSGIEPKTSSRENQAETIGPRLPIEEDPETLPEPYSAEAVAKPEALERFLDPSIDDYLESSEALLKHLDQSEENAAKPVKSSPLRSSGFAFKFLGGILAIALLVGIVMSILKQFSAKSGVMVTPLPPSQTLPAPSSPNVSISPTPSVSASSQPSATVSPSPAASTQSSANAPGPTGPLSTPAGTSLSSASTVSPIPSTPSPTPTPTVTASPTPAPSAAVPSANFYVVVTPYQGDASFQRAKRFVPDAFVADIKGQKQIQLSFLEDLRPAKRLVNELKTQGLPASIVAQN